MNKHGRGSTVNTHTHTHSWELSLLMNIHAAVLSFVLTLVRSVFLSVTLTALSGWTDTHPAKLLLLLSPPLLYSPLRNR